MKFIAQEWLDRYGGDPIKALESLHKEVELRETENGKFRDDVRDATREKEQAQRELEEFKAKAPKESDVMDDKTREELAAYRALGPVGDVSQELTHLRSADEEKTSKIFDLAMEKQLRAAGIDDKYLPQALAVIKSDDKYFKVDEADDAAEVEFSLDEFKTDNAVFFAANDEVSVLGGSGKGAGEQGEFKSLADNYVKNTYEVPVP